MNVGPMTATLIDLTRALEHKGFTLILGGGFGLYLKQLHRQAQADVRTLIPGELWPRPRATEDLDVFLPTEFLVSLSDMRALRAALDALGFVPVEDAKYLHFSKPSGDSGRIKIDMLTGPILDPATERKLKITRPRVRPHGDLQLHAYLADDAVDFERSLLPLQVEGTGSDGQLGVATVHVPHPFTFALMKLHAFADRVEDRVRDLGRHHALDVYRIVAMLTPEEYDGVRAGVERHPDSPTVARAREIVSTMFGSPNAIGILRLREHSLFEPSMNAVALREALADLFR